MLYVFSRGKNMKANEINRKVGKIRSKKLLGAPLFLIVLVISALLVGAAILFYGTFAGTMSGDIDVTGVESIVWP